MYLNKAFVIGNLTRDPEIRAIPSGMQVASFSVATNRVWKDKEGRKQEAADYHNVVVFGRQAEIVGQYLKKGANVLVEGRMQTRSWDASDGTKKYRTEIVADRVQFGQRTGGSQASNQSNSASQEQSSKPDSKSNSNDDLQYPEEEINIEDIPF